MSNSEETFAVPFALLRGRSLVAIAAILEADAEHCRGFSEDGADELAELAQEFYNVAARFNTKGVVSSATLMRDAREALDGYLTNEYFGR